MIGETIVDNKVALKLTLLNPCVTIKDLCELVDKIKEKGQLLEKKADYEFQ